MAKYRYTLDDELTEEDIKAQEEWKEYVRTVDKLDRQARIRNRILVAIILIAIVISFVLILKVEMIVSMT